MRILFTNDDGYNSHGLHAVADLFKDEHEIAVVAPDTQKSGFSHSFTMKPHTLTCREIKGYGYKVYAVGGTPVDCVKLACTTIFKAPDLVISGINNGENLGSDVMYSGTVSAASEGVFLGSRAIALSLDNNKAAVDSEFDACAAIFKANFEKIISLDIPKKTVLNINFPKSSPKGVRVEKMNTQVTFMDLYDLSPDEIYRLGGYRCLDNLDKASDEWLCHNGYITITPLVIDRTDYGTLNKIKDIKFKL
ncbi:MAG: 5'/3'-nucleotidase SurE [Clostridiales bacterium]|nr:5'/3'-nucleotidase SurE [Clostridiales bacterium]